jgi:hypothetical protein
MLRRKREIHLRSLYRTNPSTGAFIIEISLDDYNDIFNGWDPSPVKRRDLDPELIHYLEECASDIPLRYPLELHFFMPKEKYEEEKERLSKEGIANNFNFTALFIRKDLRDIRRKIATDVLAAFSFLSVGYLSRQHTEPSLITTILLEGLSIGGWVFLWEAFSLFFFQAQDVLIRLRRYIRFQETQIIFKYR